jgi:hypothetical protein
LAVRRPRVQIMVQPKKKQPQPESGSGLWLIAMLVGFAAVIAYVVMRPQALSTPAPAVATTVPDDHEHPPRNAAGPAVAPPGETTSPKPGAKGPLPPLPVTDYPAVRPPDVVRAAYEFAARHPEILQYVPCFCGCEHLGHGGNDDCFVSARDAEGNVTWDAHGMGCTICIDVARDAMQMRASGASVADIRLAIERTYAGRFEPHTPTPPAPRAAP